MVICNNSPCLPIIILQHHIHTYSFTINHYRQMAMTRNLGMWLCICLTFLVAYHHTLLGVPINSLIQWKHLKLLPNLHNWLYVWHVKIALPQSSVLSAGPQSSLQSHSNVLSKSLTRLAILLSHPAEQCTFCCAIMLSNNIIMIVATVAQSRSERNQDLPVSQHFTWHWINGVWHMQLCSIQQWFHKHSAIHHHSNLCWIQWWFGDHAFHCSGPGGGRW